tara:strand:+ start:41941 stop:42246 length:306 start_codon:yes stop_codon:yes gene_type:complete
MTITGTYQVSEIAYGDKEFAEIVEDIIQYVNDGHEVHQGNEQLDTWFVLVALKEDDSDGTNEGLTYAIRGIQRDDLEQAFDEKLRSMAEDLATSFGEVTHG